MPRPVPAPIRNRRRWVACTLGLLGAFALASPWDDFLAAHLTLEMDPQALLPQRDLVATTPDAADCDDVRADARRAGAAGR